MCVHMVYRMCVITFPFPSVCIHADMWFPVCPCHLIHTLVHHYHPASHRTLCERAERPRQRHGETTARSLVPRPSSGGMWEGEYPSVMKAHAPTQTHDLKNTNIQPASGVHLCTWHLSIYALISLLHCPH